MPGPWVLRIAAQPARESLARLFARRYQDNSFAERIAVAADLKTLDRHMTPAEIANLHRLARGCERKHDSILPQADPADAPDLPQYRRDSEPDVPQLPRRCSRIIHACLILGMVGFMAGANESVNTRSTSI